MLNKEMNQQALNQGVQLPTPSQPVLTVKMAPVNFGRWYLFAFVLLAWTYFQSGSSQLSTFFLLAVPIVFLLLVFQLSASGKLSMDSEEITCTMSWLPLCRYQMRWDEVGKVEMDVQGSKLIFFSLDEKKRMITYPPKHWHDAEKPALEKLMEEEMQKRRITLEKTGRAAYMLSKNTQAK